MHKGHQEVVNRILKEHNQLIIVIGGADSSYTKSNSFTSGERIEIIKKSLNVDFKSVYVITLPDIDDNILWPSHVDKYTPEFNLLYSNNPLVEKLFSDAGYNVKNTGMIQRSKYSGTNVRKYILEDDNK